MEVLDEIYRSVPAGHRLLIDTAPRYGHGLVESWIGECSASLSDRFLVATKCGRRIDPQRDNQKDFSYDFLAQDIESSLMRLRANRLFLVQLHNPSLDDLRSPELFTTMETFRDQGLIDWYGVSINHAEEGIAALETSADGFNGFCAIQFIYSIITKRGINEMLQLASARGVATIAREVLCRGVLSDKFLDQPRNNISSSAVTKLISTYGIEQIRAKVRQVRALVGSDLPIATAALRYSIENPDITVTLAGINHPRYVREAWSALTVELPSDVRRAFDEMEDLVVAQREVY